MKSFNRIACILGHLRRFFIDKERTQIGQVIQNTFDGLKYNLKIISQYIYGSLKTEKQIEKIGKATTKYGLCPYKMVHIRKVPDVMRMTLKK